MAPFEWCRARTLPESNASCPFPTKTAWPRNLAAPANQPRRRCGGPRFVYSAFGQRRQTHPARCTRAGYGPRRDHFGTILYRQRGEPFRTRHPGRSGASTEPGIGSASAQASLQARAALPSNQEAVRFYTEGQERLWAFDYIHARDLLTKPSPPTRLSALACCFGRCMESSGLRDEGPR